MKQILPNVLEVTDLKNVHSLHGNLGTRKGIYINLEDTVISSHVMYLSLFLEGLKQDLTENKNSTYEAVFKKILAHDISKEYLSKFYHRTFLRKYDSLIRTRPSVDESAMCVGQNHAEYGLFVSPRYRNNAWENDKSEIRHLEKRYWSIGHVLETGLVIPNKGSKQNFSTLEDYLGFFENVIVRQSGSKYQIELAAKYSQFVRNSQNPNDILLLIPELRYNGLASKHQYRLDFAIIDVESGNKIGIELSPWSSHGRLEKTKDKTQKEINQIASQNFDKEMQKHKDYFREFGIITLIYTNQDLEDMEKIFEDIKKYIQPSQLSTNLSYYILNEFNLNLT